MVIRSLWTIPSTKVTGIRLCAYTSSSVPCSYRVLSLHSDSNEISDVRASKYVTH